MMFAKEAEALAYAEPLVPKRFHTWLRVLTQWKNEKERNGEPDRWIKYFGSGSVCCSGVSLSAGSSWEFKFGGQRPPLQKLKLNWVKYFCPYFTTEGLLGKFNWAWDDARRVGGADGRKLVRIVTAWRFGSLHILPGVCHSERQRGISLWFASGEVAKARSLGWRSG